MSVALSPIVTHHKTTAGERAESVAAATDAALHRTGLMPVDGDALDTRTTVLRSRHAAQMAAIQRLPPRERLLLAPLFDGAFAALLTDLQPYWPKA